MTPPSTFTAQTPPPEITIEPARPVLPTSHKGVWIGLAAGAAIAGGIAWFAFGRSSSSAPVEPAKPTPLEAAQPRVEAPPPTPPKPAPPPVAAPAPAEAPAPVEAQAPADKPAAKAVVKHKPVVAVKPKEPPKPEPPKPEPPPKDPTKDNKWDRNSLTLPK